MTAPQLEDAKRHMLQKQLERRGIQDKRVLQAMDRVPRERFVTQDTVDQAYADRALAIDCGQTISQPYIVGLMTQALEGAAHHTVLEVGTGSGYQTAILAELAREVISIERHAELSRQAAARLTELGLKNVTLTVGDGTLGWPARAPYDRVLVTAAAARCPPALVEQLKEGGILVMPVGSHDCQNLQAIRKVAGSLQTTNLSPCRFVRLIGAQGWPK